MNQDQIKTITQARGKLGLNQAQMARAMGAPYDSFKDWQNGRRRLTPVGHRCIELLLELQGTSKGKKYGV